MIDEQVGTKRLTLDITLPILFDGDESYLGSRPLRVRASGLSQDEAAGLAETWGQADHFYIEVTAAILDALS